MIVAISGPVGVGKSALVRKLAESTGLAIPTDCLENAFREHFLADPARWGFQYLQAHLTRHFERWLQVRERSLSGQGFLFDGFLHEESRYIHAVANSAPLSNRERDCLTTAFDAYVQVVPKPDLVVSLSVPRYRLLARRDGRVHERRLGPGYLDLLDNSYDAWIDAHADSMNVRRVDWTDFGNFNAVVQAIVP